MTDGSWDLLKEEPPRHPSGQPPNGSGGEDGVPWSATDVAVAVALVIVVFLSSFVILGPIIAVFSPAPAGVGTGEIPASPAVVTFLMIVQWIITLAVPLTYFKIRGYRLSPRILGFRRARLVPALMWLLAILAATFVFGGLYDTVVQRLAGPDALPSSVPSQDVTTLYGTTTIAFILTFVVVALVTPVVEELFFRGIVHRGLEQGLGFLPGASISSLIFALAHLDYRLFIPIFFLGFAFAFLVHKTGSIWPTIGGHFVINSLGVILRYSDINVGP